MTIYDHFIEFSKQKCRQNIEIRKSASETNLSLNQIRKSKNTNARNYKIKILFTFIILTNLKLKTINIYTLMWILKYIKNL